MSRLAVYALVQEKSGLKIKPSAKGGDEDPGSGEGSPGDRKGNGVTMAELASDLPNSIGLMKPDFSGADEPTILAYPWALL